MRTTARLLLLTGAAVAALLPVAPAHAVTDATIANFRFAPDPVTVPVGSSLRWTNTDGTPHTVTADDGSFSSGHLGNQGTFSHTFDQPGDVAYHCDIHPSMQGTVHVSGGPTTTAAAPTTTTTVAPTTTTTAAAIGGETTSPTTLGSAPLRPTSPQPTAPSTTRATATTATTARASTTAPPTTTTTAAPTTVPSTALSSTGGMPSTEQALDSAPDHNGTGGARGGAVAAAAAALLLGGGAWWALRRRSATR